MKLRRSLWEWSSIERQRKCGRVAFTANGGAVLRSTETGDGRRAGFAGLQSCGLWTCPVCVRSVSAERAKDVAKVLHAAAAQNVSVGLATFTMAHRRGTSLRACWEALNAAWRAATSGGSWQKDKDLFGVVGWVRAIELTVGANGPHLHAHVLLVFDSLVSQELMQELASRMYQRWNRSLAKRGFEGIEDKGGLDVVPVQLTGDSIEATATYVAKASMEAVSSATKHARGGNRSPMQILADAVETGNAADIDLFWEIEQTCQGRKKLTWAKGIREWAGMNAPEKSDEDIVNEDRHGESVLILPKESWAAVRHEAEDLLEIYEEQGLPGAERWLRSRGLAYKIPGQGRSVDGSTPSPGHSRE